jgi:3-oxoacyl-[acyl-carrier protein] reductase
MRGGAPARLPAASRIAAIPAGFTRVEYHARVPLQRVAVVAASSRGLGKAAALGLAREGCRLAIFSRDAAAVEAAAREIGAETGAPVFAAAMDVTREAAVRELVGQATARFGRIDICVSNAGGPPSKIFDQTSVEEWLSASISIS